MTIPFLMVIGAGDLRLGRARRPRGQAAERADGERHRPAVHLALRLPEARRCKLRRAGAARGPAGRVPDPHQGRDPLLLGARVPAQVGRGARASRRRSALTPDRIGNYEVVCAELCGLGHSTMRQNVRVVQPAAFDAWLASRSGRRSGGAAAAAAPSRDGAGVRLQRLRQLPYAGSRERDRHRRAPTWARSKRHGRRHRQSIEDPSTSSRGVQATSCPGLRDSSRRRTRALVEYLLKAQK